VTVIDERPATAQAELLGVFEPGSPAWHAARANGIGGSEIAAVLGLSKWESAFSLWHRKRGLVPPREASTEMEAGRRLEPVICDVFAERHPDLELRRGGTFRHRERAYQIANPDELVYIDGSLAAIHEAKYALFPDDWGQEGTDEVPVYYQAQGRWYGDVFGVTRTYLTAFIGSTGEFREYVIDADEQDTATMRTAAEAFMRSVEHNVRPRIDGHEATFKTVKELPDGQFDVDVELYPLLRDQYFDALQALDAAKAEKNRAASLVLDRIDTGRRAMCLGERVATRTVRDGKTYSLQPARNRGNAA
jgi:putative phage-type endonuclease